MIRYSDKIEEAQVAALARLLELDQREVVRRAINDYYLKHRDAHEAFVWLESRLAGAARDAGERPAEREPEPGPGYAAELQ